jgi:GT2 family glycosyltransferase
MGYFHGLNFAINKIDASKFSHIVVGNNDLIYEENFFDILISSEYPNNAMVICPNIITKDGYHQNPHHINKLSKLQIFFFDLYFYNYLFAVILIKINRIKKYLINSSVKKIPNKVTEIYQGVGACYVLMPLFFIRNSELYFPGFLYGEEACLSHQVKKSGGKLYFDPKLLISHEESATLSKLPKIQTYKFGRDSYWKFRDILNYDD